MQLLDDLFSIETQMRRISYYAKKSKKDYKFEHLFISLFNRLIAKPNNKDQLDSLRKCRNRLGQLISDPYENSCLAYFDLVSWIDNKITAMAKRQKS